VTLAFLWWPRCIWEIDQAQLEKPPWSGSSERYRRCHGCGGGVSLQRDTATSALLFLWIDGPSLLWLLLSLPLFHP
jgi:hypothetical protein